MQRLILATSFLPKTRTKSKSKDISRMSAYARAGQEAAAGRLISERIIPSDPGRWEGGYGGQDWSSKEGHRADALALRADERRDKLR